jgi:CRISPR-associated protein Csm2
MNGNRNYKKDNRNQRSRTKAPAIIIPEFNNGWMSEGIDGKAIEYAELLGEKLAIGKFTTSQFRNFYGELKRIQLNEIKSNKSAFHLLQPKLAYAAKRASSRFVHGPELFKTEIFKAIKAVKIDEEGFESRFKNFCDLTEAILAYHKSYE